MEGSGQVKIVGKNRVDGREEMKGVLPLGAARKCKVSLL